MANEEKLLNQILSEGKKLVKSEKYEEASNMFLEAYNLDKWKEVYGTNILTNLAYTFAMKGNIIKAK